MPNTAKILRLLLAVFLACFTAVWAQQAESEDGLTARDMFRKAAGRLVPAPANAPAPARPVQTNLAQANTGTAKPATSTSKPATGTPKTDTTTIAKADPLKTSTKPATGGTATQKPANPPKAGTGSTTNGGAQVILASTNSKPPLGLRYSLVKQMPNGDTVEVDSDTVFRSGERIRLTVATTETAYVYIVNHGTSGKWKVLFPSPEIGSGSNLLQGGMIYQIPAGQWFAFNDQVGVEKLFVMVSRTPQEDLDSLIYQIKEGGTQKDPTLLMAANIPPVDDALISNMRSESYARDLVFEKVNDAPKPASGNNATMSEKAVYVVNKSGSDDSRVTADINLKHQ